MKLASEEGSLGWQNLGISPIVSCLLDNINLTELGIVPIFRVKSQKNRWI